jgi:hypothetical protein
MRRPALVLKYILFCGQISSFDVFDKTSAGAGSPVRPDLMLSCAAFTIVIIVQHCNVTHGNVDGFLMLTGHEAYRCPHLERPKRVVSYAECCE